jgi:hypothetical protein
MDSLKIVNFKDKEHYIYKVGKNLLALLSMVMLMEKVLFVEKMEM